MLKILRHVYSLIALLCALVFAAPAFAADMTWSIVEAGNGDQVGYTSEEVKETEDGRERHQKFLIKIRENNSPLRKFEIDQVFFENPAGKTVRVRQKSGHKDFKTRTDVRIDGNTAHIRKKSRYEDVMITKALEDDTRFDSGRALLRGWDFAEKPVLEFDNFNLSSMAVERITVTPDPRDAAPEPGNRRLVRKAYDGQDLRAISFVTVDESGDIIGLSQDMFGSSLTSRRTDKDTARKGVKYYSVIKSSVIDSAFRINRSSLKGNIRYRFKYRDGLVFEIPQSAEQRVAIHDDTLVIDICDTCGPVQALSEDDRERYLSANLWIQSDHKRFARLAKRVSEKNISDHEKMQQLGKVTRRRMREVDFTGHYTALEALARGSGDCGEDALVLAALGRAAGIPTRIASGLVYSREKYHGVSNVFLPHTWVQAWIDGGWRSYDISLGEFDASHILISAGEGDTRSIGAAAQLAARLEWDHFAEVKRKDAVPE